MFTYLLLLIFILIQWNRLLRSSGSLHFMAIYMAIFRSKIATYAKFYVSCRCFSRFDYPLSIAIFSGILKKSFMHSYLCFFSRRFPRKKRLQCSLGAWIIPFCKIQNFFNGKKRCSINTNCKQCENILNISRSIIRIFQSTNHSASWLEWWSNIRCNIAARHDFAKKVSSKYFARKEITSINYVI